MVGCIKYMYVCVQNTVVEGTSIMQLQAKGDLLPGAIF